jgi:predicted NUDIX family NTP pyrophosphohydrolase
VSRGRRSAGLLLYRRDPDGRLEVLLGHMGGPFWARRDAGAWSIPKGEHESSEEPFAAACRELTEELGVPVPDGPAHWLGEVRQAGGKVVAAWAIEADVDPADVVPGTFTMEWPPRSGRYQEFPELDRVAWLPVDVAREKLVRGQVALLDALVRRTPASPRRG